MKNGSTPTSSHIPALDGLRGLAIALVFVVHVGEGLGLEGWAGFVTKFGWAGVDCFFVLSGFLITGILLDTKQSPGWFRNFYVRRLLRIFPLYYGVLAAVFLLLPLTGWQDPQFQVLQQHSPWLWAYATNWLLAFDRFAVPLNLSHLWSLAIEEQFYLVWPLMTAVLSRRGVQRVAIGVIVAGFLIRSALYVNDPATAGHLAYFLTFTRLDSLMVGAWLASTARGPEGLSVVARFAGPALIACGAALAALAYSTGTFAWQDGELGLTVYPLLAVFFGAALVKAVEGNSRWSTLLSSPLPTFLGRYSYGLYVFHFPIIGVLAWKLPNLPPLVFVGLAVGGSVAAAVTSYHLYEVRFLRLKRYFEYRPRSAARDGVARVSVVS